MVWFVVGIALALPAGLWLVQVNMEEMTVEWQGRPGLSVYFELDASPERIYAVKRFLLQTPSVKTVKVTSAADALAEFKNYSGLGDALELLDENPLPASLQAQFADGITGAVVDTLTEQLGQHVGVGEVVVEKTWLERLNDISSVVSRLSVVLAILFGMGAVLVTASSVRLAIEARLDELRVLKLVGATAGQIRRPFLYFGVIYGFGGGVIASMLIAITVLVIEPPLQSLLGSYDQALNMVGFDPIFLVVLLAVGGSLGVLGALIAVRQRLVALEIF